MKKATEKTAPEGTISTQKGRLRCQHFNIHINIYLKYAWSIRIERHCRVD